MPAAKQGAAPAKTAKAQAFIMANRRHSVVAGAAIANGGQGAHYTLENGKTFELSREECEQVGRPRWRLGR